MFSTNSKNGFSLKAYQGSEMTLLAMDLDKKPAEGTFAGFTLYYTSPGGVRNPIQNMLNFDGTDKVTGSDESPIQLFKWVHFPGSYQQTGMLSGRYRYEAIPRYFNAEHKLKPLDNSLAVYVDIDVKDFSDGGLSIGFTRGFTKSQAFSLRYGADQKLKPSGDWMFDINKIAGQNAKYGTFTFSDMYKWLGFNARSMLLDILDEALSDNNVKIEMFAYDFSEPLIATKCLELAKSGKIRIILDNCANHSSSDTKKSPEDDFEEKFRAAMKGGSDILRCHFARYSHDKQIILRKNNVPVKVLTGSTNFSVTGLYVNANHVIVFDNKDVAAFYSDVFNKSWELKGKAPKFRITELATQRKIFTINAIPRTEITVSPHSDEYAASIIDEITAIVKSSKTKSVLFSVMEMGKTTTGSLIPVLREIHENDSIFSYGITDNSSGVISLYKPGEKKGLLIDAKKANRELPPPFREEFNLGLSHAIHHKFVVTNFNKPDARVYCGSSNLALGGECDNGDNLLCIKDTDVATVFAIEAMRLTDHYNFRSKKDSKLPAGAKPKPVKLDEKGVWVEKFFNRDDIRYVERETLA